MNNSGNRIRSASRRRVARGAHLGRVAGDIADDRIELGQGNGEWLAGGAFMARSSAAAPAARNAAG